MLPGVRAVRLKSCSGDYLLVPNPGTSRNPSPKPRALLDSEALSPHPGSLGITLGSHLCVSACLCVHLCVSVCLCVYLCVSVCLFSLVLCALSLLVATKPTLCMQAVSARPLPSCLYYAYAPARLRRLLILLRKLALRPYGGIELGSLRN